MSLFPAYSSIKSTDSTNEVTQDCEKEDLLKKDSGKFFCLYSISKSFFKWHITNKIKLLNIKAQDKELRIM